MRLKTAVQRRWDLVRARSVCGPNETAGPHQLQVGHTLGKHSRKMIEIRCGLHARPCELRRD